MLNPHKIEGLTIRLILPADNKAIATVIRESLQEFNCALPGTAFADPATDSVYEQFLEPNTCYFVAIYNNELVGGCGINLLDGEPDKCELQKLYLNKDARGKGIATVLLDNAINFAIKSNYKGIYLETKKELSIAVPLYEKRGFQYLSKPLGNTGHFNCEIQMYKEL